MKTTKYHFGVIGLLAILTGCDSSTNRPTATALPNAAPAASAASSPPEISKPIVKDKFDNVYALFDTQNIGLQLPALEKKLDVLATKTEKYKTEIQHMYEAGLCDVKIITDEEKKIQSIDTSCSDKFPEAFKLPATAERKFAKYFVRCGNCGNAVEPSYILKQPGSHANPVGTEYTLQLENYDGIRQWEERIQKDNGIEFYDFKDNMANCTPKYQELAKKLWNISGVQRVKYTSDWSDISPECESSNQMTSNQSTNKNQKDPSPKESGKYSKLTCTTMTRVNKNGDPLGDSERAVATLEVTTTPDNRVKNRPNKFIDFRSNEIKLNYFEGGLLYGKFTLAYGDGDDLASSRNKIVVILPKEEGSILNAEGFVHNHFDNGKLIRTEFYTHCK